jgi:MFS family permease
MFYMKDAPASASTAPLTQTLPYPSASYAWYVVVILYLAYTFSFVDRSITGYLVGPIRKEFAINDFQFSLMQGMAFTLFFTIGGIPIGRLADSRSRRLLILIGVAVWSSMTILCGKADNYWELFFARMGVGVGEACLAPCAYSLISDYFPREKRSLPLNMYSAGVMLGSGVANVFGGLVARYALGGGPKTVFLLGELKPWQQAFVWVGLPGAMMVLLIATIREPYRREKRGQANAVATLQHLRRHWATYASLIGGTTFGAMTNGAILGWIPVWFERRYGWHQAQVGPKLGLVIFAFGTIGLSLAGYLAGRYIRAGKKTVYIKLMIAAEGMVIIPLLLAYTVDEPYWVLGCVGAIVFFTGFPSGLGPAALQWITPNEMRGQITAAYLFVLSLISGSATPAAVGYLTTYYFADDKAVRSSAVLVGVVAAVLGVISLLVGLRAYERTAEAEAEALAGNTNRR